MIKKIKALAISVLLVFSSSSIANAVSLDSFAIGVTASHGAFEATGTETVASSKQSEHHSKVVNRGCCLRRPQPRRVR